LSQPRVYRILSRYSGLSGTRCPSSILSASASVPRTSSSQAAAPATTLAEARARLHAAGNPGDAVFLQRYFKTGPGEYGEGDRFLGIRVPALRGLVRELQDLPLNDVLEMLRSEYHEERLFALLLMVRRYQRGDAAARRAVFDAYLANTRFINNWDLVDSSAADVVGAHLADGGRGVLETLARSELIWERRIAIIATLHFIRRNEFATTLKIAEMLLDDRHDLMHKAVGWMLREVGKRDLAAEEGFLRAHYRRMPRTALRYAIERFPEPRRQAYLRGEVD
jgi:3-methyladenine DNA glycosylase AlkD